MKSVVSPAAHAGAYHSAVGGFGGPGFVEAFDPGGHPLWMWTIGGDIGQTSVDALVIGPDGTIYAEARGKIFHFNPV